MLRKHREPGLHPTWQREELGVGGFLFWITGLDMAPQTFAHGWDHLLGSRKKKILCVMEKDTD